MSGVISPVLASDLLRMYFQRPYVPAYSSVRFALTRRVPVANAAVSQLDEPVGGGYRRSDTYGFNAQLWPMDEDGVVTQVSPLDWPLPVSSPWGSISGWAMLSEEASPQVLAVGRLLKPVRYVLGMKPRLPPGAISFGLYE